MPLTAGETFGVNAGTSAVGAGFGILSSYLSNKWARENADHDREENYKFNELAAGNADARTRALYNDLYSPHAQMQQLKDAGLSPSVFYANGAGGISGQTGAQGEGVSGVKQDTFGIPNISPLDFSQIELNKAQARNLNADASIKEGSKDDQLRNWYLTNKNLELKNGFQEFENRIKAVEAGLKENYGEDEMTAKINLMCEEAANLVQKTRNETTTADINEKTKEDQIRFIQQKTVNLIADTHLKRSQKKLNEAGVRMNDAQAHNLYQRVLIDYQQLCLNRQTLEFNKKELEAQVKQWGMENGFETARQIEAIVSTFLNFKNEQLRALVELAPF